MYNSFHYLSLPPPILNPLRPRPLPTPTPTHTITITLNPSTLTIPNLHPSITPIPTRHLPRPKRTLPSLRFKLNLCRKHRQMAQPLVPLRRTPRTHRVNLDSVQWVNQAFSAGLEGSCGVWTFFGAWWVLRVSVRVWVLSRGIWVMLVEALGLAGLKRFSCLWVVGALRVFFGALMRALDLLWGSNALVLTRR